MSDAIDTKQTGDIEIDGMSLVYAALKDLEKDQQQRILSWVADRLALGTASLGNTRSANIGSYDETPPGQFADIAGLYDAAGPKTDSQRALVAAYWFQVIEKQPSLDAHALNSALKNLGHGLSNITDALSSLMKRKPSLALQTQKMGKSRQARKKYKLTTAGVRVVESMIRGSHAEEE